MVNIKLKKNWIKFIEELKEDRENYIQQWRNNRIKYKPKEIYFE